MYPVLCIDPHGVVLPNDMPGVVGAGVGHECKGGVEGSAHLPPTGDRVGGEQGAAQPHLLL